MADASRRPATLDRPIWTAPRLRAARRLRGARHPRPHGRDALLLLRPAVRRQAAGEGRDAWSASSRGRSSPSTPGKLCPKGIKRYLQNNHPDRLLHPLVRTGHGFAPVPWDEALDLVAERLQRHPAPARPRRRRRALGRLADQREGLSHGQVRAPRGRHPAHRLQRPALHGRGRRRQPEGLRHRSRREPLGRHRRGRPASWCSAPTSPSAARSPPTTSGARATAAPG